MTRLASNPTIQQARAMVNPAAGAAGEAGEILERGLALLRKLGLVALLKSSNAVKGLEKFILTGTNQALSRIEHMVKKVQTLERMEGVAAEGRLKALLEMIAELHATGPPGDVVDGMKTIVAMLGRSTKGKPGAEQFSLNIFKTAETTLTYLRPIGFSAVKEIEKIRVFTITAGKGLKGLSVRLRRRYDAVILEGGLNIFLEFKPWKTLVDNLGKLPARREWMKDVAIQMSRPAGQEFNNLRWVFPRGFRSQADDIYRFAVESIGRYDSAGKFVPHPEFLELVQNNAKFVEDAYKTFTSRFQSATFADSGLVHFTLPGP